MFGIENLKVSLNANIAYLIIFAILASVYAVYIYKNTLPVVSLTKRIILNSLRILGLLLILFLLFEPKISFSKKNIITPETLVFIDNSRSVLIEDGTGRKDAVNKFVYDITQNLSGNNFSTYTFGQRINKIDPAKTNLTFAENVTDISSVFPSVDNKRNISSIVIISDGVVNSGGNPVYAAGEKNIPVFTVSIGDTSKKNDVEVKNILFNEYIYQGTETTISSVISNSGFAGKNATAILKINNSTIETKDIILSENGTNNVSFNYSANVQGEQKITVEVLPLPNETSVLNNKKIAYLNVLNSKLRVLIISGSPSADLAFLKKTAEEDKNLIVNTITQLNAGAYVEKNVNLNLIDSADIIFMTGFPNQTTSPQLLSKTTDNLISKKKPFLILYSGEIDHQKLNAFQTVLPFVINRKGNTYTEVQPQVVAEKLDNPLLGSNSITADEWNGLPPVLQLNSDISPKPGSEVLSRIRVNNNPVNIPLIISRIAGSERSAVIIANEIWRWKLQSAPKGSNIFNNFINNSVKWLNSAKERDKVDIKTTKRIYAADEKVEFVAQVYDESLNPVDGAEISVNIKKNGFSVDIFLNSIGSGLYEGALETSEKGDFSFSGKAVYNGKTMGTDAGSFNIGEIDLEMTNSTADISLMRLLANTTSGKSYYYTLYSQLFEDLKSLNAIASKEKIENFEYNLWSNEYFLILVILLFSAEWFIRKQAGML